MFFLFVVHTQCSVPELIVSFVDWNENQLSSQFSLFITCCVVLRLLHLRLFIEFGDLQYVLITDNPIINAMMNNLNHIVDMYDNCIIRPKASVK